MGWVQRRQARVRVSVPLLLVIVLALLCSAVACYAEGSGRQSAPGHLDLNVVDLDLSKIVQMLMRDSKQSIVIRDQEELGKKKVTATLNDLPFEKVLQKVVESVGGYVERDADGVYVISKGSPVKPAGDQVSAVVQSDFAAGVHARNEAQRNVDQRDMITDVIKIYNTSAQDLAFVLTHANNDYLADSGRFLKFTDPTPATPKSQGSYIINSNGSTYPAPDGSSSAVPLTEGGRNSGQDANRAVDVSDPSIANQMGMGNMGGGGMGSSMGGGSGFGGNSGGSSSGMGGSSGRSSRGMLPDSIEWVIPYPTDNSLIVRGDEEGIAELKELIRKLDIVPKQIMIKIEFVEIGTTEAEKLGIEWSLQKGNTSFQTAFSPTGNIAIGYATGNVIANLHAQISSNKAKLVNSPMLTTMNNMVNQLTFQQSIPYWTSTTAAGNGSAISSTSVNFLQVQTGLMVLPRVSPADNSITIVGAAQLSDVSSQVEGPTGTIPVVTQQSVPINARVRNGETFVIGGLVRKQDSLSETGIPFLKDLPLIGPLFRSTAKNKDDTETLYFITPTIRPDSSAPGVGVGVVAP